MVIMNIFLKLTKEIPMIIIDVLMVGEELTDYWVSKYGIPVEVLSENGSKFSSKFFM